jgi:hypothetical protein
VVGRGAGVAPGRAVQLGQVRQLVAHPHLGVQPALLRHVAHAPAHARVDRTALPPDRPGVTSEDTQDDAHRRRLAGAVAPDEAEHLPRLHGEAHPVQGERRAVALDQTVDLEHAASLHGGASTAGEAGRRTEPAATAWDTGAVLPDPLEQLTLADLRQRTSTE